MGRETKIKERRKRLKRELKELDDFEKKGSLNGKYYYTCKTCGGLFGRVGNDYAQEGYCSDCWRAGKEAELREKYISLIGATIVDIKIKTDDFRYTSATLGNITIEKDGKREELKLRHVPIRI